MKKSGLLKRIGLAAAVAGTGLAMIITGFTGYTSRLVAHADAEVTANATLFTGIAVKDSCDYGSEFTVPAAPSDGEVTVIKPNGGEIKTITDNKVRADQIGIYKVRYTNTTSNISYDYKVKVTLDKDYFLRVDYNGADIPTYIKNGSKFKIPGAKVMYYDDNKALTKYPGDCDLKITDSRGAELTAGNDYTANGNGKVYITYNARVANGTKVLSRTFTVNIQSEVNNAGTPSLSVSGVQKDASVSRPVTLPVAKVTDNTDDNVRVEISVKYEGTTPVKNVVLDEDGYVKEERADEVVFDNDKSMTFYPTKLGKYLVTYTAYNDSYDKDNPSKGGKSGTSEFTITVADHVAPVFKSVDEYLIPETWGISVKKANNAEVAMSGKIKFTVPTVVDNKDHMKKISNTDETDEDLISVYFRITDSDYSRTVLEISNILGNGTDNKISDTNMIYTATDRTFNNENKGDGFTFDFSKYERKDNKGNVTALPGTYTVLYRARDKANNTSSKTYTITLKENYEDTAAPSTAEVDAPEYISVADGEITLPRPEYADASDTRPQVTYRVYTDAAPGDLGTSDRFCDIVGGETAKVEKDSNNKYWLVINPGAYQKKLLLNSKLYFYLGVTDKVGNFKSNAIENTANIDMTVDGNSSGKYDKITAVTNVIKSVDVTDPTKVFGYAGNISFKKDGGSTSIAAGDNVNAGGFKIETAGAGMRYYTGFEVVVYDPQGNIVNTTLETMSVPGSTTTPTSNAVIYVQNIKFNAAVPGSYIMTVRVFDVNGYNHVYGYKLTGVATSSTGGTQTSATATIGSTGSVNVKYKLNNQVIKNIPTSGTYYVVRKITGGAYSLMGSDLIAMSAGSYTVRDGYLSSSDLSSGTFEYSKVKVSGANDGVYNFSITDSTTPVIELQDAMPTYVKKFVSSTDNPTATPQNGLVTVPKAVAYTENGMGEIKVSVKYAENRGATASTDVDFDENAYTFVANRDGKYTVTYAATYGGASANATYDIYAGDVFAPVFKLSGGTSTTSTKKEGEIFTFATIELEAGEEETGVTVKKEIYEPSREVISGSTVSGSYVSYRDKKNNGTDIVLNNVGDYTVVYTVTDAVGNEYKLTEKITVLGAGSGTPTTWTALSTALIIIAIVLLAGVIVYVVRFRKVKK